MAGRSQFLQNPINERSLPPNQLSGRWIAGYTALRVFLPTSLWLVVAFFTVVRYLLYLNLRIRHEGWEVELALRAEANKLTRQPA